MDQQTENQLTGLIAQIESMQREGQLDSAIDHWREAAPTGDTRQLKLITATLNKLGARFFSANRIETALTYFTLANRAEPNDPVTLNNLGTCYKELGDLDKSTDCYCQAITRNPAFAAAHSNLLMNLHYDPNQTPASIAAAHREWDDRHAKFLRQPPPQPATIRDPEKPLRVGLVSADLGQHPVGNLLVRYLENRDQDNFAYICYADRQRNDPIAKRIRAASSLWRDTHSLNDAELAAAIAADNIDILIDLAGHSAENRLGVFARKPAPIQLSWIGYPGDNGLSAMDYVIGDPYVLPESVQPDTRAKILELPHCFICFDPPADAPQITPLPAIAAGRVTFGCFHNPAKCNDEVLNLWAEILRQVPQSRLLLKYKGFGESACQNNFKRRFAERGIDASRLEFQGASPMPELYPALQSVDLMLDPFPFAGGMMSLLSLWMGVPLITWPRETFASRQGLGFLSAIGITDTLATSREDYIDKAITLANDLPRLADLRQKLRPAMAASPLCDGQNAATNLQYLLRKAWRAYCAPA